MTYLFSNTSSIFQSNGTAISTANPLAVTLGGANITISGNTNIISNVEVTNFPNVQTVTGNVNATVIGNVTVSSIESNVNVNPITGNVTITSLGNLDISSNSLPITGNVGITGNANVVISGLSGATADAFGRLRVSNPVTIFDTQSRYFDHGQFASNTTGTANVVYVASQSSFQLNVGSASGDSALRETTKTFAYQPGKSQLNLNTFCMNSPKPNLRQRVGLFDSSDGCYFENDGTYNYFVIRSGSTGVEERIRQDAWNVDRLNPAYGLNPSGYTLYPDRTQILFTDIEWLGVGTVRMGFVIDGAFIICHKFHHANQSGNTKVYMTTATLPIRYEITNTAATTGNSMMTQICSSVISEGGFQLSGSGNPRAASHVIGTPVRLPNDQSFKPVIAIRLKSTNLNAVVIPINYSLVPLAQSVFHFRVYKKAVTSGGSWVSSATDSSVEYNLSPTSLVSGDIVAQSFINSSNQSASGPTQESISFTYQLERDPFTGVAYEYLITMATTGTNQDIYASIEWQEIS